MILPIIQIALGIVLSKIMIEVFNEGYRYKWKRVRLELNKLQRGRKQQKKEVKVPCAGKESLKSILPES